MRTADVAVVGAGPAGIGAALAAARNGVSVVLIDENAEPGGHLRWTMAATAGLGREFDGTRGIEIAGIAERELQATGVRVLTQSVAWGLFEVNVLGIVASEDSFQLQATTIIIATGSTDIAWPFPGWELPGVVTATATLRMLHLQRVLPGRRVAVLGSGTLANEVAADLKACGASVVARVTELNDVSVGGVSAVEWLETDGRRMDVDAVVLAFGRQPDPRLAFQAQARIEFSASDGVFVPTRSATLETSLPNVFVVGDAAGVQSNARAFAEGTVAGEAASGGVGLTSALERLRVIDDDAVPAPALPVIADGTLVCRCEEIAASVLRRAIADGAISLNDLKRRTRSGMGICQGVFCARSMAELIASESGIPLESIMPMTARPPARPISMAALADFER